METTLRQEWFSYPDAERFSGLSRTTLWRLIGAGEVNAAHVGRSVRINRRSLEGYLERATGRSAPLSKEMPDEHLRS